MTNSFLLRSRCDKVCYTRGTVLHYISTEILSNVSAFAVNEKELFMIVTFGKKRKNNEYPGPFSGHIKKIKPIN